MNEAILEIRGLISLAQIEESIEKLEKLAHATNYKDEVLIIQYRNQLNQKNNRIGVINYQDFVLENNKICQSILEILSKIGKNDSDPITMARKIIRFCKENHIKYVNLSCLNLDFIPEDLAILSEELVDLNLSNNSIEVIPIWFKSFKKLKTLNLSKNRLKSVSETLGELHGLVDLDLSINQFKHLPESLCKLEKLERIDCIYVDLESLPRCLFQLADRHSLKFLHLEDENLLNISEDAIDSADALRIMLEYLRNNKKTVPNKD